MSKCRYKVGDCVVYMDTSGYWKVFKILEIGDGQCKYRCLDIVYDGKETLGQISHFNNGSNVGKYGVVVKESEYMSYVTARVL